jgi:thiol-disulfide isomerase/thioredoxin
MNFSLKNRFEIILAVSLFIIFSGNIARSAVGDTDMFTDNWFAEQIKLGIKAPEFPKGMQWLNTGGRELRFANELKGRIVVIDFWTYCCINCMHVLPDLEYLEEKYSNKPLVILGCHSAKFNNEQVLENIRQAVLRYTIRHPVVVDENNTIWDAYTVNSWPTLVVVDPQGFILGGFAGEGHRQQLDALINAGLSYYGKKNLLAHSALILPAEAEKQQPSALLFPGKGLLDPATKRLFISDSNNNRFIVTDLEGTWIATIGSGTRGKRDGSFAEAEFNRPQGMALHNSTLYIADTENHLIRAAQLNDRRVTTVAGTGKQTQEYFKTGKGIALSSPWDLAIASSTLYIAMAGTHQIWQMDITTGIVSTYAGSGRESCTDGSRLEATFAQPSGLAYDGRYLYVADSEASSIRRLDLHHDGRVETVAGSQDLFGFGFRDGAGNQALFQHPLGVCWHNGYLYVADTYNHAIRRIDAQGVVDTVLKKEKPAAPDSSPQLLYEPGGIAAYDEKLYIADTNNHRIQVLHVMTGTVNTLALKGGSPPQNSSPIDTLVGANAAVHIVHNLLLNKKLKADIRISIVLPPQHHLLDNYQSQYLVHSAPDNPITVPAESRTGKITGQELRIPITTASTGSGEFEVQAVYGYCSDKDKLCIPREVVWKISFSIAADGGTTSIDLIDKP